MRFQCTLKLPRDARALPIARHCCTSVLQDLGVHVECIDSISFAFNEACANVVQHSDANDDFEVSLDISRDRCSLRVLDRGGFDIDRIDPTRSIDPLDENGRGIPMMHNFMDKVTYADDEDGTSVVLEKELLYDISEKKYGTAGTA